MNKLIRHPLSWVIMLVLVALFAFFIFPVTTDTGEEMEMGTDTDLEQVKELKQMENTDVYSILTPEPVDKTEVIVDTLQKEVIRDSGDF